MKQAVIMERGDLVRLERGESIAFVIHCGEAGEHRVDLILEKPERKGKPRSVAKEPAGSGKRCPRCRRSQPGPHTRKCHAIGLSERRKKEAEAA